MIEHYWEIMVDGKEETVEWDSVSGLLIAPVTVSLIAEQLVEDEETVYVTPVGPRVTADLDEPTAAWATISYAIELSGYELVDGSDAPIEPEPELLEGNPANE